MSDYIFKDVTKNFDVSGPVRGDIVCANLTISEKGSLIGNVEAENLENNGRFQGSAKVYGMFSNNADSVFRGTLKSKNLYVDRTSIFEAVNTLNFNDNFDTPSAPVSMNFIQQAVDEALHFEKQRNTIASKDANPENPKMVSIVVAPDNEIDLSQNNDDILSAFKDVGLAEEVSVNDTPSEYYETPPEIVEALKADQDEVVGTDTSFVEVVSDEVLVEKLAAPKNTAIANPVGKPLPALFSLN